MKVYKIESKYKNPDKYIHQLLCVLKKKNEPLDWPAKIFTTILILSVITIISISSIGIRDYIVSHKDVFTDNETMTIDPSSSSSTEWYTSKIYYFNSNDKLISSGNCVDKACAIIFNLKRNYPAMDRVKIAVSDNHCQAVIDNLGEKSFLTLQNGNEVYESNSEFSSTNNLIYVDYDKFLKAVEYFRPTITKEELLKYLSTNYRGDPIELTPVKEETNGNANIR